MLHLKGGTFSMMISPETFYCEHLEGKSADEIQRVIRGLKQEIGRLKNIAEHPKYQCMIMPNESTRIFWNRKYLEQAKIALIEAGGTYTPSQAEIKAMEFEDNIPFIEKIVFTIGSFCGGYTTVTIQINNTIHKYAEHSLAPQPSPPPDYDGNHAMSREDFFHQFSELHIGEWRKNYNLRRFGYDVLDGEQWSLELYFSNGHKPVKIYGDNAYPYNFDSLQDLIYNSAGM